MRSDVNAGLDKASMLDVGRGQIDLFAWARGDLDVATTGIGLEASHRLSKRWTLWGLGELGASWGDQHGALWRALAGARATW